MRRILIILFAIMMFTGCMNTGEIEEKTNVDAEEIMPDDISSGESGLPLLKVHVAETGEIETMDIETYLMGVVAGEMKNDWPLEALKAQAILARTFTLKFLDTKDSKYEGADISTDISEAQAYAPDKINAQVREAVNGTKGIVMVYDGELPHAWFHAHSGGVTEVPTVALDYKEDPEYLGISASYDSEKAPDPLEDPARICSF